MLSQREGAQTAGLVGWPEQDGTLRSGEEGTPWGDREEAG